jgi:hypothetical protein
MRCVPALFFLTLTASAHDMTTAVTWSREISRLVNRHCAGCHRDNGKAFPLTTFGEAHDRAPAIARAVLARRMPPFGAVKGFGDLRDDTSLTQEQIELFVKWVQTGAMEGDPSLGSKDPLPQPVPELSAPTGTAWEVKGARTLDKPMTFKGITAVSIPSGVSVRIVAQKPDGSVEPLIWFNAYDPKFARTWLFRKPTALPVGTRIVSSVPDGVTFSLLL